MAAGGPGDEPARSGGDAVLPEVTAEEVAHAVDRALLRYDRSGDEHYDVISAFIKSVRGSDVDAALHYLARMIEAGEDPRFIARRIIILASEDIGMADPQSLPIAVAAAQAVQLIGMPEGASRWRKRSCTWRRRGNRTRRTRRWMPRSPTCGPAASAGSRRIEGRHIRGRSGSAAQAMCLPADDELGVVAQRYLPDELADACYYAPHPARQRAGDLGPARQAARHRARQVNGSRPRRQGLH